MSDWIDFEAVVEPMEWGDSVYTVVRLPDHVDAALRAQNAKRVEGEFNDHPVNLALTTAPVFDGTFLWAGKSLLQTIDIQPGEPFEARLRPADPNHVETPEDIYAALTRAGVASDWDALSAGKRRASLHHIQTAKRAETRSKRISALVEQLQ